MIALEGLTFTYPGASAPALRDVWLRVEAGALALVVGPSGSGKSTLLRCLNGLVPHFSGGRLGGRIEVAGRSPALDGPAVLGGLVGFVFQDPEAQFVLERVEDEVAFALENRALPPAEMARRVEGVLARLGLLSLRDRPIATLSGGQKQRVAIAAALALEPSVLVLDEPTSQLDPGAAEEVLAALSRLNRELGLTVVLAEHRLERVLERADQVVVVESGRVRAGPPREIALDLELAPPVVELARELGWRPLPLSVAEARAFAGDGGWGPAPIPRPPSPAATPLLRVRALTHTYPDGTAALDRVDLDLASGEVVALMGANGSGKTTLLRCLVGLLRPAAGAIELAGQSLLDRPTAAICQLIGYLPQLSDDLLFAETVADELAVTLRNHGQLAFPPIDPSALLARLGLAGEAQTYPRDLSAGQRQRVALAAIAVTRPRALLLDEPTRGMDRCLKGELVELLRGWRAEGTGCLLVTHDVELAARVADRVVILEAGGVAAVGAPGDLLGTQIARLFPGAGLLIVADALSALRRPPRRSAPA
ncbi:MAG TPA: ATP-binding cassette domain-containing protein [Chloroflexota bacterium]|jgi:energy-coupling factor transport system ATP-binding protein